jgi:hypothetical protein
MTVIEHAKNQKHETEREHAHEGRNHGGELERTLRHALALAMTERAVRRGLVGPQVRAHRAKQRARLKATGHLVGYGALVGYIVFLTRDAKQPAAVQAPSPATAPTPSAAAVPSAT